MALYIFKGIPDSIRQDGWWLDPFERYRYGGASRSRGRAAMVLLGMAILTGLLVSGSLDSRAEEGFSPATASHSLAPDSNGDRHP